MSSNEDLQLLFNFEPWFFSYSTVCFSLKVFLLIPVIYVITNHSPQSMESYKFYLIINVVSTATWGFLLFLAQPIITAPSLIVCSSGFLKRIPSIHFHSLIGAMIFVYLSHITSTFTCLLYQYVHLKMSPWRKYFYHYGKAFAVYITVTTILTIPIATIILASNYSTDSTPTWILEDNPSLNFSIIESFLQSHPSCFKLYLYDNIIYLSVSVLIIAAALAIVFGYIHSNILKLFLSKSKEFSKRTGKMQWNLYKFILIQTLCIILFYMIPIMNVIATILFQTSIASIGLSFSLAVISSYELANLLLILTYIGPYRQFLIKTFLRFWVKHKNSSSSIRFKSVKISSSVQSNSNKY